MACQTLMLSHFLLVLITLSLKGGFNFLALRAVDVNNDRVPGNSWFTRVAARPIVRSARAVFKSATNASYIFSFGSVSPSHMVNCSVRFGMWEENRSL